MTREEKLKAIKALKISVPIMAVTQEEFEDYIQTLNQIMDWLEQESKTEQFAKWVATEIFDDDWKYNKHVFAEVACRKLAKLGIVRKNGGTWELVEPQESEVEE